VILWQVQAEAHEAADLVEVHVAVEAHMVVFQEVLEVLLVDITAVGTMVDIIPHQDITITEHFSMAVTSVVEYLLRF
jgi:hypothetical protein